MRIKKIIFLEDYKKFPSGTEILFNENRVVSLVGQNGSGKTTIMSALSSFFYHLERYDGKIEFALEIQYSVVVDQKEVDVLIVHKDNVVQLSINGGSRNVVIPRTFSNKANYAAFKTRFGMSKTDIDDKFLHISDIKKYLPSNVLGSIFSIHGEYPNDRNQNYIGELKHISKNFSLENFFGRNHWSVGNISLGILAIAKDSKLFKDAFGLKWTGRIKTYDKAVRASDEYGAGEIGDWMQVTQKDLTNFEERIYFEKAGNYKDGLYINDIEFLKADGQIITLNNMSAGEKSLFLRIMSLVSHDTKNSLVLIEEPELFLNPVWQKRYVDLLLKLFSETSQIIFTTHSPYILEGVKSPCVESYVFTRNNNVQTKLELDHYMYVGGLNLISYKAFGIVSESLHIELFTILEIQEGGLSRLSKKLSEMSGIETMVHTATVNYGRVKAGDSVEEPMPIYIRNAIHHPDEKARIYDEFLLKRSIAKLISLVDDFCL